MKTPKKNILYGNIPAKDLSLYCKKSFSWFEV